MGLIAHAPNVLEKVGMSRGRIVCTCAEHDEDGPTAALHTSGDTASRVPFTQG